MIWLAVLFFLVTLDQISLSSCCWLLFCYTSFQIGVFSHSALRDGTGVLQQFSCPGAVLFNQRVGTEEGAGFHKMCGSVSSCRRGAGTAMPAGGHHQDGVQGNSLDVPLRCCESSHNNNNSFFSLFSHFLLLNYCFFKLFHRFSLLEKRWKMEESSSANLEGSMLRREFRGLLSNLMSCELSFLFPSLISFVI